MCLAPGMCPASHSSLSRTSSSTIPLPLETMRLTSEGSTSSTELLIWRMTSAPEGLMRSVSLVAKRIGIQYFRKCSGEHGVLPGRVPADEHVKAMRTRSLLSQVLAVNTVLVAATAIIAALLAPDNAGDVAAAQRLMLIALAVVSAVLLNSLLLKRRLAPLD